MRRSRHRLAACRRDNGERDGRRNGLRGDSGRRARARRERDRSRSLVAGARGGRSAGRSTSCRSAQPRARPVPVRPDAIAGPARSRRAPAGARVAVPRSSRRRTIAAEVARHFPTDNPADEITAFHPLARIAWFARRQPESFDRIGAVLEPKDFLNFRLTGVIAADSVTYSRFDHLRATAAPLPDWLERCRSLLALRRIAPWQMLGRMTNPQSPFGRLAGIPVFAGAMDAWATAVGSGAIRAGQGYDIAGTSEVAGLITHARAVVPGLVSLLWGEDVHQIGGPTQAGADSASWCHRTFRVRGTLAAAVERAGSDAARRGSAAVPALSRGRANAALACRRPGRVRGAVARTSTPTIFSGRCWKAWPWRCATFLRARSMDPGQRLSEVRVAGGGAQSNAWCQIKADVMQRAR